MKNTLLKINLSLAVMMLMQFLLLAVWWVPLAAFLTNEGIEGSMKSLILSSMAIGSMASPVIGALADRYISAQKVLAIANVSTGLFLLCAGFTQNTILLFIFIFLAMICYMPTWSLTSSIAMRHAKPELFPRIRLFGSIGWIVSGIFSLIAIRILNLSAFDGTNLPILCGSGIAFVAAALNHTLPDTPPNKNENKASVSDLLGFKAFAMLRERNYRVFIICSFAAMFSFAMYYSFGSEFLQDRQFQFITITMNWGQAAELVFLFFTTTLITRLGIKWAMALGLIALTGRYLFFLLGGVYDINSFYMVGILFHGLIFGLFFVGGQIYTDRKSPEPLRAQAQGMLSFLLWGIALLMGNFICGALIRLYTNINADGTTGYDWNTIFGITTVFSVITLVLFIMLFKQEKTGESS